MSIEDIVRENGDGSYTLEGEDAIDFQEDGRTAQELEDLKLVRQDLRERYRPLMRKANEQLARAEENFLAANDARLGAESEYRAMKALYVAQNVANYYKHTLLDIRYAYKARDLAYHSLNFNGDES